MSIRSIFLVLLSLTLLTGVCFAGDAGKALSVAQKSYDKLLQSPSKQKYRDQWQRVINRFKAVADTYGSSPEAGEALFQAANAWRDLYRNSLVSKDARSAVAVLDQLVAKYPDHPRRSEALTLAGDILAQDLKDDTGAQTYYQRARASSEPPKLPVVVTPAGPSEPASQAASDSCRLSDIRFWSNPGYTRVVLALDNKTSYRPHTLPGNPKTGEPPRIYLDIDCTGMQPELADPLPVDDGLLRQIRTGSPKAGVARVVLDLVSYKDYKIFPLDDPFRIVIDVAGSDTPQISQAKPSLTKLPESRSDDVAKVLEKSNKTEAPKIELPAKHAGNSLRRVVVDAGHGGKDPGAVGPSGIYEKDVTLALALAVGKRLKEELGCEVVYTRKTDVFIPLEDRTALANKVGADLFLSIHANASPSRNVSGIETFYLNFSKNDKAAEVAARENGTSLKEVGDLELILFDLMANSKINESSRLANEIQTALVQDLADKYSHIKNLGVRQGPFYVLLGATMPSVLVETAFISNHTEEKRLNSRKYRQHAADAIVRGVYNYAKALKLIATR